jgi:hypothetical protein
MRHEPIKVLKPAAQLEAERLGAFDELCEITNAIDLAALAVIGMAKELGGEEGNLLANYLRDQAERIRKASALLLAAPDETFSPTTELKRHHPSPKVHPAQPVLGVALKAG